MKNRPRPKHGHKYTKREMCLIIMMVIGIKQHLSNILSSIHEKIKQHWDWVKKSFAFKKSVYCTKFLSNSKLFSCRIKHG